MLEVEHLSKTFVTGSQRLEVLRDVTLQIPHGQFVAVTGASGSGKSTLLGLMAGLDTPTAGSIRWEGREITRLGEDELATLRGRQIGYVFQSFQLIPTLTAEENVQLPCDLLGMDPAASRERARVLLGEVGLAERRTHYPVQLSGGEQQRVALARAFVARPPWLLADEPTGNLDSKNGALVLELLLRLHREQGATLILVTHDATVAARAERVLHMQDGELQREVRA